MDSLIHDLIKNEEAFIPLLIFIGVITLVLIKSAAQIMTTAARERTKREIAAYIAEGSMSPEQGERILKAGDDRQRHC
ncbi:MAG: hypothetical protein D6692_13840 [Planctomycetota bacterium]|nr:MAG: hypothetical protein D6692_13840 [Planctomycetota bacterium]